MAIKKVFKSRIDSCKYIFSNGKEANFIGGKYLTDLESEIAALEFEIKSGHPHIYIDTAEKEIDTEQMDPIEQIKKKAIAEYIAAQKAAVNPDNNMGSTEQGKLTGISNSRSIAALTGESLTTTATSTPAEVSTAVEVSLPGVGGSANIAAALAKLSTTK